METFLPLTQTPGTDPSVPTCRETQCNSHGSCVVPPGGGARLLCDCDLGYQGEFCDDTIHGDLSLPLTVSLLVIIVALVILAFVIAKVRQRQKKKKRRTVAEKHDYNIVKDLKPI